MHFEKISKEQWDEDVTKVAETEIATTLGDNGLWTHISKYAMDAMCDDIYTSVILAYEKVKLPARSTAGSAGYDFYLPYDLDLAPNSWYTVCTGIRAKLDPGTFLMIVPRSSLGVKYDFRLDNTVGIIDEDYYNADNEGHIMLHFSTGDFDYHKHETKFLAGTKIAQGIILPYLTAENDQATGTRTGGFGSTGV